MPTSTIDFETIYQAEHDEHPTFDGYFENTDDWFAGYTDLLNMTDVARIMGVSRKTVQRWCLAGVLPSVKISSRRYIPKNHLASFIESQMVIGDGE